MNKTSLIALAAFVIAFGAQAAEPGTHCDQADRRPCRWSRAAAPQKPAAHSQQDKMRECNKQATGKKGPDRRAFMKTCLSKKKA